MLSIFKEFWEFQKKAFNSLGNKFFQGPLKNYIATDAISLDYQDMLDDFHLVFLDTDLQAVNSIALNFLNDLFHQTQP